MDMEAREEESRSGKREGVKEEEETVVVKRRCVNLFSRVAFEEFSPVHDSDSCGDSSGDLLGDSCGLSECVPAVSSGVPVVTDVPDSPSSMVVIGRALLSKTLIVRLWNRSPFLSPESVMRSAWRIKKT